MQREFDSCNYNRRWTQSHLRLLVRIVSHDEAEEEPRHHNVSQPEHGEMAAVVGGGEHQLARQTEPGGWAGHVAAEVEAARHRTNGVVGRAGRNLKY